MLRLASIANREGNSPLGCLNDAMCMCLGFIQVCKQCDGVLVCVQVVYPSLVVMSGLTVSTNSLICFRNIILSLRSTAILLLD